GHAAAARRAARRDASHERRQLLGGADRGAPARFDEAGRDPARERLLAVAPEQRGQLVLVKRRQQLERRHAAARVEAHVERATRPDPEATFRVGELEARQPEVEEAAIDRVEALLGRYRCELAEFRLAEAESITEPWAETGPDPGDGRLVGVETEEAAIRIGGLDDAFGVAPAAQRGVDLATARRGREHRH